MRAFFRRPGFFFLLALLLRLPALFWHERWNPDSLAYLYLGGGLWRGHFPLLPLPNLVSPPGCALALGWISFLPMAWQNSAGYLLQAMFSAALVFPIHALTRRRFGARAAPWAAFLVTFAHPFILTAAQFQAEAVYLLALFGGIALLERRDRLGGLAAPLLALAALTRGEGPAVVAAALLFAALRANANHRPHAFTRALVCAGVCLVALGSYALLFRNFSGQLPWAFYFKNAAGVGAMTRGTEPAEFAALLKLRAQPMAEFLRVIATRLPVTMLSSAGWWLFGMLPGALFVLLPALPAGLWRRLQALRVSRGRGLDPLDGICIANTLIFLIVWRARHHAPMGLGPLIPVIAAALAVAVTRWPRWLAFALAGWSVWALVHVFLVQRNFSRQPELPGTTLGSRFAPAGALTDDFPALDAAGRGRWLGTRKPPLLPPDSTPDDWRRLAAEFPATRIAIHNEGLPVAAPPAEWPKLDCQPGLNDRMTPICAYEIPVR